MNFFILRGALVTSLMSRVNDPLQGDNVQLVHFPSYLLVEDLLKINQGEKLLQGNCECSFTLHSTAVLRLDFHCWPVK